MMTLKMAASTSFSTSSAGRAAASRSSAKQSRNTGPPSAAYLRFDGTPSACAKSSRSEEHTSELQSLMRISYAVFCLKKKNNIHKYTNDSKSRAKKLIPQYPIHNTHSL